MRFSEKLGSKAAAVEFPIGQGFDPEALSSIVTAAIRLHDQRVPIGQAAGATAAVSLREKVDPRQILYDRGLLEAVRDGLCSEEMEGLPLLLWPARDLKPEDPWFLIANRLPGASTR